MQVRVRVHRTLRPSRRAGRIEPERHVVGAGVRGHRHRRLRASPARKVEHVLRICGGGRNRARNDHVLHIVTSARKRLLQRRQQRARHQQRLRAAMRQHERVIVSGEQRVDRDRHDARKQRAQERHGEIDRVLKAKQDPFFAPHAERDVRRRRRAHAPIEFAVGQRFEVVDVRRLVAARPALRSRVAWAKLKRSGGGALRGHCVLPDPAKFPVAACKSLHCDDWAGTLMHAISSWQAVKYIFDFAR